MKYTIVYKNKTGITSLFSKYSKENYDYAMDAYRRILDLGESEKKVYCNGEEISLYELREYVKKETSQEENICDENINAFLNENINEIKFLDRFNKDLFTVVIDMRNHKVRLDSNDYEKLFFMLTSSEDFKVSMSVFDELHNMFTEFNNVDEIIQSITEIFYFSLENGEIKIAE